MTPTKTKNIFHYLLRNGGNFHHILAYLLSEKGLNFSDIARASGVSISLVTRTLKRERHNRKVMDCTSHMIGFDPWKEVEQ